MTFEQFCHENFAGDEKKAMAHLVHESYYCDFSLTGSKEDLQALLDTFDKDRCKQFWKAYRAAVRKDNRPFLKETGLAPLVDVVSFEKTDWAEDEEFIRKGNPFGRPLLGYSLLFLVNVIVFIVLRRVCAANAWSETARMLISAAGMVCVPALLIKMIFLFRDFFSFRKAEKRLHSKQTHEE